MIDKNNMIGLVEKYDSFLTDAAVAVVLIAATAIEQPGALIRSKLPTKLLNPYHRFSATQPR
jgi:hypothetical protein